LKKFITDVAARGWLSSFAILLKRIVPESLIRFRYFHVYQLNEFRDDKLSMTTTDIRTCTDDTELRNVAILTRSERSNAATSHGIRTAWLASIKDRNVGGLWIAKEEY
jgi:hypothetical protein